MAEITPNYPLEWEHKAFEELLEIIKEKWKNNRKSYKKLSDINSTLLNTFEKDKIGTRLLTFISKDKNLADFFERFLHELITSDPFLTRIYLYNSTMPHELPVREGIKIHHLPDKNLRYLKDLLKRDFLVDSDLAKSLSVTGIPLRFLFVGKLLDCLFSDFKHYWLIDKVAIDIKKRTGDEMLIEELREKTIYETKAEMIFDYSPLLKITFTKSGPIYEVFNDNDFKKVNEKELMWLADEILCFFINKSQNDSRKNLYFGDDLNSAAFKYTVRYEAQEKKIPFQLLPKYKKLISKIAMDKPLTGDKTDHDDSLQEGMSGLYNAAITWDKSKGPATNWLSKHISWQSGKAFEKLSTTHSIGEMESGKPILKEKLESGQQLDGPIDKKDTSKGIIKDTLEDLKENVEEDFIKNYDTEKAVTELYKNNPEIKEILDKEKRGEALNATERQIKSRVIRKERSRRSRS